MKLVSLRLQNFRQHADTSLEFDDGLTGIIGANGSGKTTILEAIAWALYGNAATRGTRESIRFSRAGARAGVRVELVFDLAGHRYRVIRGLTNAELYLDGASAPIANSITGVSELLQRRLGMSRPEFFNTYFTGQKELNVMAAMGPSERAQFLSRVLGYEKLRTAQQLVRDRRRLLTAEIAGLMSGMPDADAVWRMLAEAESRVAAARTRAAEAEQRHGESAAALQALRPRWERAQLERQRLQELLGELKVAENEDISLLRDAERIEAELAEIAGAQAELQPLEQELLVMPGLQEELKRLDALAREEGRRQTLLDNERVLNGDLAKLDERRTKLETAPALVESIGQELATRRAELDEAQASLDAQRTDWVRDQQEATTKLDALRAQYSDVKVQRDRVVELGADGACPTCTRRLGENFQTVLESLDEQLVTLEVDGKYFVKRVAQLKAVPEGVATLEERKRALTPDVAALERRLSKVQAAVQELAQVASEVEVREQRLARVRLNLSSIPEGYDSARHALVKSEVERLGPVQLLSHRLAALLEREPAVREQLARVIARREGVRRRVEQLAERRESIQFSEEEYETLRVAHDRAAADAHLAELTAVSAQGDAAAARAALDAAERARRELAKTQEMLDALNGEKKLHDELDRAYTDLRTDLNFALRPELSELASSFLTDLTDARYNELELDDQYNVLVLEDGVPKPVISGGEEDLANLVLRLAISQMIAERAGQQFSLLILDEVFGSLDESRRHNVVELLRRLQDRFEQVILITHIESVREGLDRVVLVRYDEESGSSVVEQSDGGAAGSTAMLFGDVASGDDSPDDTFDDPAEMTAAS